MAKKGGNEINPGTSKTVPAVKGGSKQGYGGKNTVKPAKPK